MIKALIWDRGFFPITIGNAEGQKVEVSGWVDQQKLWGIHRVADANVVTHLRSGRAVTSFGGGASKRATARAFCAAINHLTDWQRTDIGRDAALARRLHEIAVRLTGDEQKPGRPGSARFRAPRGSRSGDCAMTDFYSKQKDRPGWNKTPSEPTPFYPKQDDRGYSGDWLLPPSLTSLPNTGLPAAARPATAPQASSPVAQLLANFFGADTGQPA
jgi:hypothetical protein